MNKEIGKMPTTSRASRGQCGCLSDADDGKRGLSFFLFATDLSAPGAAQHFVLENDQWRTAAITSSGRVRTEEFDSLFERCNY
jgi:hypothetical protein